MNHLTSCEAEALTYCAGDVDVAALYARINELELSVESLEEQLDIAKGDSLAAWESAHIQGG